MISFSSHRHSTNSTAAPAARAAAPSVPAWALPSLLPAVLARSYLRRLERRRYDLFDPGLTPARPLRQIRLLSAAVTGRY